MTTPADDGRSSQLGAGFTDGAKLIRLTEMLSSVVTELRQLQPSPAFREQLARLHRLVLFEVEAELPSPLAEELERLLADVPPTASTPELRVAHAELVGWLEGLVQELEVAVVTSR